MLCCSFLCFVFIVILKTVFELMMVACKINIDNYWKAAQRTGSRWALDHQCSCAVIKTYLPMAVSFPRHVVIVVVVAVRSSSSLGVLIYSLVSICSWEEYPVCKTVSSCVYPYSTPAFTCVTCL